MSKKILLAVDGSSGSVKAAKEAVRFGKMLDQCTITMLYVINKKTEKSDIMHCMDKSHIDKVRQAQLEPIETVLKESGIDYTQCILKGEPAETIATYAKGHDMNWIFIGSRGHGTIQSMVLGSVSQEVVQETECPVFIIK